MASHRHDRAASTLRREISRILAQEIADPNVSGVFISTVSLAPDKRSAKVFVAPPEGGTDLEPDPAPLRALERATPAIRSALGRSLRMRRVPELRFAFDLSDRHAQRIDSLLERVKKRSRKGLAVLLFAFAVPLGDSVRASAGLERMESSVQVMGSEFRIACYATTKKRAAGAITAAFDEVRRVDEFLSHYKPNSELSQVNRDAANRSVAVSAELAKLLAQCQRYTADSRGAFDIAVGALVDAWGFYEGQGSRPSWIALWRGRRNSGSRHLELDLAGRTVRFRRQGLRLDPGGIGKGYAVDRAVRVLREYGIERALVSAGTSSVFALGSPPATPRGWPVDLRSPTDPEAVEATVVLRDESISTSGSYEKYFEDRGKRYSHILDPRTGLPAEGVESVSVVSARTLDTEAWSTALFVNGADWIRANPLPGLRVFLCEAESPCRWLTGE